MGNRDNERDTDRGHLQPPSLSSSASPSDRVERHDLCGQVLFCTLSNTMVVLDVVADQGRLPAGTPFIVTAELPGGFLGAVVESVVERWSHDLATITARVSRYHSHTRVDLMSDSTRVVLDVESVAVPTSRAA